MCGHSPAGGFRTSKASSASDSWRNRYTVSLPTKGRGTRNSHSPILGSCQFHGKSGVIRLDAQIGKEQLFSAGTIASAVRLNRDKDSVDVGQDLWIFALEHPSLVLGIVGVKDAEIYGIRAVRAASSPGLKGIG